ncbi:hypothetical protein N7466_007472 [Penicillium verhagenii]|uniref:uncharacterized protein n=1 Tax=Penicillium verhagenii TaxID=1562060 RepID=UPI002545028D|nr:uncharacterized protein N7466_007472 [Penicillium verhagenii]KAJ5928516.1 hypothetical protein N7466_007472 [Penicillium verhagenii]
MSDHNETESGARSPKTRAQLTKNQSAVMLNENHTEPSHRSPRTHPQRSRQPEVVIPRYNEREPRTRLQRSRNADAARSHYDATNTMIRSPGTRRRQNLRITDATMSDRSDKISNDINAIIPTETAPEVPASPSNPGEPETVFYEGLAKKDIELKDWVVDKVQIHSAWSEVWMEFYVGAFKLLDYVHSPMPASFKDALQFIKHWTELYDDLETPPTTKLGMQTSRFRAATFSEIKGILNFSDLPNGGYDREEAGEVVVELEGYLLPHLAILVMRSFKAYTQFGRMVTSAFDDSLGLLVDCSERINALRSYYTSEINQQRSWRLGKRAKKIRTGLKQHTLRMFVTAQARESFETGRPPATFNKWTQSEERWLREAWDMYRCEYKSQGSVGKNKFSWENANSVCSKRGR